MQELCSIKFWAEGYEYGDINRQSCLYEFLGVFLNVTFE